MTGLKISAQEQPECVAETGLENENEKLGPRNEQRREEMKAIGWVDGRAEWVSESQASPSPKQVNELEAWKQQVEKGLRVAELWHEVKMRNYGIS